MEQESRAKALARIGAVAAVYVMMTVLLSPVSFGAVQFRLSEILVLLCFFRKDYCISLIVGCALANLFSPFGWVDVFFGTLHTAVSVFCIAQSPKLWLASIFPALFSFIIGFELYWLGEGSFWILTLSVMLGEVVAVVCMGLPLFLLLSRNQLFLKTIGTVRKNP